MMRNISFLLLLLVASDRFSEAQNLHAAEVRNLMSDNDISTLKERNMIKRTAQLQMQFVSPGETTVIVDGVVYDCSKLKPWTNLIKGGNVVSVDGKPFDAQRDLILKGTVLGADVMVVKDDTGNITFISIFKDHQQTTLIPSGVENILMTVNADDYDMEKLSEYILNDDTLEKDGLHASTLKQAGRVRSRGGIRSLQQCDDGKEREIEIAIGLDSSFCSKFGGSNAAVQKVQAILAEAGRYFEMLNIRLTISKIEGFCSSTDDPYQKEFTRINASNCGDGLSAIKNLWEHSDSPFKDVHRDVAHVFIGKAVPNMGSVIGCAFTGALCGSWAYALNNVGFTNSLQSQVYLVTHELGHNSGASHSTKGFIMNPGVGGVGPEWETSSVQRIKNHVCNQSCIAPVTDSVDPTTLPPTDEPEASLLKSASKSSHCAKKTKGGVRFVQCRKNKAAFHWTLDSDGHLRNVNAKGLCLTSPKKTNKYLKLDTCTNKDLQKWSLDGDGSLRSKASKERCVRFEGNKLQLIRCKKSPLPKEAEWIMDKI